jgi:hypothetical protein
MALIFKFTTSSGLKKKEIHICTSKTFLQSPVREPHFIVPNRVPMERDALSP